MSSLQNDSGSSSASSGRELKILVVRFQSHEESFRHYAQQINHALTFPNEYEPTTFQVLLTHEEAELAKLRTVFHALSSFNRRPYQQLMKQYEAAVQEHRDLIGLLDDEDAYLGRIKDSKQVNLQLLGEYMETLTWQYLLRGVMALVGAFMVHVIIGASSRWNFLNVYVTSYYKVMENPYLVTTEDSYASPLSLFCMGVGMRAGIRLQKAIGSFYTTFVAMAFASGCSLISSYMPSFELYVLFAFALYPLFASLAFHAVINECFKYYPRRRLLINGVIIAGTGFGHIFLGLFNAECINPEDVPASDGFYGIELDYICREVPHCMKQTALMDFLLAGLALVLLLPVFTYNANKTADTKRHTHKRLDFEYACASQREALTSRVFWVLIGVVVCSTSGNYFLNSNFKNIISKYEKNTLKLAGALLAFNLGNTGSRALWAWVFTKAGFKLCLAGITATNMVVLSTISFIMQNEDLYVVYFAVAGTCLGGCMVCFLNFTTLVFGEHVGEQLPGYVWTAYSLANLLQYVIVNCYDVASVGYLPVLLILAAANAVALVVVVRSRFQGEWENSLNYLELKCYHQ